MDYQDPNAAAPAGDDDDDKTEVTAEGDTPVVKDPEAEEATEDGEIEAGVDGDGDEDKAEGEDEEETEAVA
jgi:hypothetical protein